MIKVNEIFNSIQGEGLFTGALTTFVRLSGCAVKCKIKKVCDTNYDSYTLMTEEAIVAKASNRIVCITGGEPLDQDIFKLCDLLRRGGHQVHIQTSGSVDMSKDVFAATNHVVCSPKTSISKLKLHRCDEIKVVFTGGDFEQFYGYGGANYHYLQPLHTYREGKNLFNTLETIEALNKSKQKDCWRLCTQLHKYIGVK